MEVQNKKIGFFDSGVGGLTVFAKIKEILPNEKYIYFGDLKNSPYGEKSKKELLEISKKVFDYFSKQDVKAVVMACNTTSANVYEDLKNEYDFKLYPIIQSCAKSFSNIDNICVFATAATVNSHAWKKYIQNNNPKVNIFEIACPEWVKIVEEQKIYDKESEIIIKKYLDMAIEHAPEKIILGCTHYPFLTDVLAKFAPSDIFINPSALFADYIKNDLSKNSMISESLDGSEEFYVSACPQSFKNASGMFYKLQKLPQKIEIK